MKIEVALEMLKNDKNIFDGSPLETFHALMDSLEAGKTYYTGCDRETAEGRCAGHHKPSDEEIGILKHSLGLDRSKKEYRNYFCAEPGHSDYPHIEQLVMAGMMEKEDENNVRQSTFVVTAYGKTSVA